jgi:hypothetical protein
LNPRLVLREFSFERAEDSEIVGMLYLWFVRVFQKSLPVIACAIAGVAAARAHHSTLAYDGEHPTTIAGEVRRFEWQNPHTLIYMDVKSGDGVEHWVVESESPNLLGRLGWSKTVMKAGDRITALGGRAKDGSHSLRCKDVQLPDGRSLPCFPTY